jgi:hypothetical protein
MPERTSPRMSGEQLHALGKKAAARWASGLNPTLTEAVTEVVKEASGLNVEQVRRVVEFANTEAHGSEFRKQGADRVIDFPGGPASAADVLRSLNDGSAPGSYVGGSGDYDRPPPGVKQASDEEDAMVAALFPHSGHDRPDPLADARALRTKIAGQLNRGEEEAYHLRGMVGDLTDRLAECVKSAAYEGLPLSEVVRAWSSVGPDDLVKVAFNEVTSRLVRGGTFSNFDEVVSSLQKTARARPLNHEHPLLAEFRDYCGVATKLAETLEAGADAKAALEWFDAFEKDAGKEGLLPAALRHLGNAAQVTEGAGRAIGGVLGGETGAQVLGMAGKAAPYVGTGLAANEAYRRTLKYNPAVQGAKQTFLSAVPGTREYNQREYELATGGGGFY